MLPAVNTRLVVTKGTHGVNTRSIPIFILDLDEPITSIVYQVSRFESYFSVTLTMLVIKAYVGKSKINSAKQLTLVGIEPGTSCILLWRLAD